MVHIRTPSISTASRSRPSFSTLKNAEINNPDRRAGVRACVRVGLPLMGGRAKVKTTPFMNNHSA